MKRVGLVIIGLIILSGCKKEKPTALVEEKASINFASHEEIEARGGYLLKESDTKNLINLLANDPEIVMLYSKSQGGLEFPIPCQKLVKYLEELIGIKLNNLKCSSKGKLMLKPSLDLWIAANLAYAISLGGYIGAAGIVGFSGSMAGTQAIGVWTSVEVNGILDTVMWSYNEGYNQHVAFTATAVIWTSETGNVTIRLVTDHHFYNGVYSWDPILDASYSFPDRYVMK